MKLDRRAVCFGMSEIGCTVRRYPLAPTAPQPAVVGPRAHTGSACYRTADPAFAVQTGGRSARPKRWRCWSVMTIAIIAVLLPLAAMAGSKPYAWPGGKTVIVRDYTSSTFNGIVQQEVAAWSAIMPGGTSL